VKTVPAVVNVTMGCRRRRGGEKERRGEVRGANEGGNEREGRGGVGRERKRGGAS
jgi:hypothetical protein